MYIQIYVIELVCLYFTVVMQELAGDVQHPVTAVGCPSSTKAAVTTVVQEQDTIDHGAP